MNTRTGVDPYPDSDAPLVTVLRGPEALEARLSAVMRTVAEEAVAELGPMLDRCTANVMDARGPSAAGSRTSVETEEEKRQFNKVLTSQFTSLMETWTKTAVEKILTIFKVSVCEAKGESAEKKKKRSVKLKDTTRTKEKSTVKTKETQNIEERQEPGATGRESERRGESIRSLKDDLPLSVHSELGPVSPDTDDAVDSWEPKRKRRPSEPMQCPSCPKTFRRKCLLERHYLCHSKPHLCSDCGKRFSTLRGLNAHSRRHTGEKPYRCPDCSTDFAYKSTFERHMRRHRISKPGAFVCSLCEGAFAGMSALQRHRCSALTKTLVCSICPQTFECRQSLADHENQHSGEKDFICEMCGESFFSSASLSTHRVTHTQRETCCDVLGLGCSDMSVLRNHLSQHSGQKLFTCDVCGKGCSHRSALKHHMLTHTGERPYVCETCGKRCGHASALQNHMRVHTGRKPGQRPVCNICGKMFQCAVNLKYHMSVHTGERPYACEQCGKKFSNPSNLKAHTVTHLGKKMHGCTVCGRRFTQSSSLKTHRRIHTGEKPYHCGVCGKAFVQRCEFTKHQRGHVPLEEDGGKQRFTEGPTETLSTQHCSETQNRDDSGHLNATLKQPPEPEPELELSSV